MVIEMAEEKKGVLSKITDKIWRRTPRAQSTFDRLHKEAGFIPLLNMRDTETRLAYLSSVLEEDNFNAFDRGKQKDFVKKMYATFFIAGSAWVRGLDNRELHEKVSFFLENYTEVGYIDEFVPDLFEEAMQLMSLSFQEIDVTNTPFFIVETKPIIIPDMKRQPSTEFDATGLMEMQQKIEALTEKLENQ